MAGKIELKLNGKTFTGWKSASVKRSLNSFASSFSLAVSQKFQNGSVNIPLGAPCQVYIDGKNVITGYIDEVLPHYNSTTHEATFGGRSKTADLVDCSAILDTGQIINGDLETVVRKILAPFKIRLVLNNINGRLSIADFQLQPGETAAAAISRLCKIHSLIYYDNAKGDLVLSRIAMSPAVGDFIHKVNDDSNNNLLGGSATYTHRDRYSHYYVKSQISGSDFAGGEAITAIQGDAVDSDMPRFRPFVLIPEAGISSSQAIARAQWEKSSRVGKSVTLNHTVRGWYDKNGELWTPNTYVNVDDEKLQAKGKLMIAETEFNITADGGTVTKTKTNPPEAFIPSPKASSKSSGGGFSGWPELKDGV